MRGHGRACGSAPGLKRGAFLICHFFLGRLGRVVHNCGRACLHAELYAELHAGNSEKKGHACFQFRTLRGRARKNGTCLFPVPNSTRAGPEKMGHACFQFRTLRGQGKRGAFIICHFFLSRHALRRRPISRPTWHSATARRLRLRTLGRTCS